MFSCPGCLQRCLQALAYRSNCSPTFRSKSLPLAKKTGKICQLQRYSTEVEPIRNTGFLSEHLAARGASKERWYPSKERNARILAQKHRRSEPHEPSSDTRSDLDERVLWLELDHLKDPLRLADRIWNILCQDDVDKATALVRMASPRMECVVSWNHIIDWNMSKGKVNTALKIYNEMKKRAQFPDSHTYLLLLRGFAENPELPNSMGNALAVYHSMSATGSRVSPTIIHGNAMLKVCARANNMDALRGVLSRLPESGKGAPDVLTYTTVLNALRMDRYNIPDETVSEEEYAQNREEAVYEGRRLWEDVIARWRNGNLLIDSDLVCAMGRLLLSGVRPTSWDDVLSLIEQTMNIPRLAPRMGTEERKSSHLAPRLMAPHIPAGLKEAVYLKHRGTAHSAEPHVGGEFDTIEDIQDDYNNQGPPSLTSVQPDSNTLSLVVEACLKMAAKQLADKYWTLMTKRLNVIPDLDNIHMYLRCLRQYRSSSRAAELLSTELARPDTKPTAKTFRIAMGTCERDSLNPNVMTNANLIMGLMEKHLDKYDPLTATIYLILGMRTDDIKHQLYAIERVKKYVLNVKSKFSYEGPKDTLDIKRAYDFLRAVVRAYHEVVRNQEISKKAKQHYQEERARLQGYLDRQEAKGAIIKQPKRASED